MRNKQYITIEDIIRNFNDADDDVESHDDDAASTEDTSHLQPTSNYKCNHIKAGLALEEGNNIGSFDNLKNDGI